MRGPMMTRTIAVHLSSPSGQDTRGRRLQHSVGTQHRGELRHRSSAHPFSSARMIGDSKVGKVADAHADASDIVRAWFHLR
jgi:hypothetical protein